MIHLIILLKIESVKTAAMTKEPEHISSDSFVMNGEIKKKLSE